MCVFLFLAFASLAREQYGNQGQWRATKTQRKKVFLLERRSFTLCLRTYFRTRLIYFIYCVRIAAADASVLRLRRFYAQRSRNRKVNGPLPHLTMFCLADY